LRKGGPWSWGWRAQVHYRDGERDVPLAGASLMAWDEASALQLASERIGLLRSYDPDDASSNPEPPLGGAREWVEVTLDLGDGPRRYRRETNTMPNWAGSCWYELRYIDPGDDDAMVDPVNEAYWMGPRPQAVWARTGRTDRHSERMFSAVRP